MHKFFVSLLIAAIFLVSIIGLFFRDAFLLGVGDFLMVKDDLQPADVIHVIAGPDYRTDYAIQLYQQGYARKIFFTGPWCPKHMVNHSEHGKQLAIENGVPEADIATDGTEINSTYAEALRLKELITKSPVPISSVIVVSDPMHMRRARWTYRKVLGDQIRIQMAPVPYELLPYSRRWWIDPEARMMVRDEYIKSIFYLARYQISWGPVRDWLATFDKY